MPCSAFMSLALGVEILGEASDKVDTEPPAKLATDAATEADSSPGCMLAKWDMFMAAAANRASRSRLSLAARKTYWAANWCFGSMRISSI